VIARALAALAAVLAWLDAGKFQDPHAWKR
jgi:hypothetical protein